MSWSRGSQLPARSLIREIGLRKWSVAAIAVLAVASAVYFSLQQSPSYAAEARVLVIPPPAEQLTDLPDPNMATEQEIAGSPEVVRVVQERLGPKVRASALVDDLTIENPTDTAILVLTVEHPDPALARESAQAFAEEYVRLRHRGAVQAHNESAREVQARIADLTEELDRIDRLLADASNDAFVDSLSSRANELTGLLVQQRLELLTLRSVPNVAEVLQPAVVLGRVEPGHARNALVALLLGLALGLAQAGVRGRLDDKVRSIEEAESLLRCSALALIPSLSGLDPKRSTSGFSSVPGSITDAFVPLRVSFLAAASKRNARVFVVTSQSRGEGRSTVIANLAMSLAVGGLRVTAICADPERHRLEQLVPVSADVGLAQVLEGSAPLGQVLLPTVEGNLRVLPCGRPTSGEADFAGVSGMPVFFDAIREGSDFVLVDSPPIGDPNAVSLIPYVDGVVFVVDAGRMHARKFAIARRQLDRMNADVLGVVFNRTSRAVIRPAPHVLELAGSSRT